MKKLLLIGLLSVFVPLVAYADITLYEKEGKTMKLSIEVVARSEFRNFFEPDGPYDDEYYFGFVRTKIGLEYNSKLLNIFIQGQNTNVLNLPDNAIAPRPQGLLGEGAVYFAHGGQETYTSTHFKQGYINLKLAPFTIKAGRFDFYEGQEVLYKDDPKINWLKKVRISEKLVGPFGWSAFQRSFDGAVVAFDHKVLNLTVAAMRPTQGGFENDAGKQISGIDLGYTALTLKKEVIPYSDARLFYIYYKDARAGVKKVDNLTDDKEFLRDGDIRIHTLGFHIASAYRPSKDQEMDFILWGSIQTGDWGRLNQKSWAVNVELGYQFLDIPLKPWVRAGYFVSSGDEDPNDNDHGTFFQLLPTGRKQSTTPTNYNYMNREDLFMMVILKPTAKSTLRIDGNILKLNNSRDLWYFGSGATQTAGSFGYGGRPSQGEDDLGRFFGLHFFYDFNKNLSGYAYYSHMWGGGVVKKTFPKGSEGDHFYVELILKL